MKKSTFLLGAAMVSIILLPTKILADAAPEPPSCAKTMDYSKYPAIPRTPTCGYFAVTSVLDASAYADKFVFLKQVSCDGDTGYIEVSYSLAEPTFHDLTERFSSVNFVAVDKNYFESSGGIAGLFTYKPIPYSEECDGPNKKAVMTMEPKNSVAFSNHLYTFVVSKDDPNMYVTSDNLIKQAYSGYYNLQGYDLRPTADMSCSTGSCFETLVYVPQRIDGQYIIVAPDKVNYTPPELETYSPYVLDKQTSSTIVSPTVSPAAPEQSNVVVPPHIDTTTPALPPQPAHVSWVQQVWNAIVSFFKNLF